MKHIPITLILAFTFLLVSLAYAYPEVMARTFGLSWFAFAVGIALVYRSWGVNPLQRRSTYDMFAMMSFGCAVGLGIGGIGPFIF